MLESFDLLVKAWHQYLAKADLPRDGRFHLARIFLFPTVIPKRYEKYFHSRLEHHLNRVFDSDRGYGFSSRSRSPYHHLHREIDHLYADHEDRRRWKAGVEQSLEAARSDLLKLYWFDYLMEQDPELKPYIWPRTGVLTGSPQTSKTEWLYDSPLTQSLAIPHFKNPDPKVVLRWGRLIKKMATPEQFCKNSILRDNIQVILESPVRHLPAETLREWFYRLNLINHNLHMPFSLERPGRIDKLRACLPAWAICPILPKRLAYRLNGLPLWKQVVAAWLYIFEYWSPSKDQQHKNVSGLATSSLTISDRQCLADRPSFNSQWTAFWAHYEELVNKGKRGALRELMCDNRRSWMTLSFTRDILLNAYRALFGAQLEPADQGCELAYLTISQIDPWQNFSPKHFTEAIKLIRELSQKRAGHLMMLRPLDPDTENEHDYRTPDANHHLIHRLTGSSSEIEYLSGLWRVFGKRSAEWLKLQNQHKRTVHDAVYYLPKAKVVTGLADFLFAHAQKSPGQLEQVVRLWGAELAGKSWTEFEELSARNAYPEVQHVGFAAECQKWKISESRFPQLQEDFIESQQLPDFISPEFKVFNPEHDLVAYFLPRSDVRGYFLGHYTGCCQHPDGVGRSCAYHGQENQGGGFFVVERKRKILAMSWVWMSSLGTELVFDNIEAIQGLETKYEKAISHIYQDVAKALVKAGLSRVLVGKGHSDIDPWDYLKAPKGGWQNFKLVGSNAFQYDQYAPEESVITEVGQSSGWYGKGKGERLLRWALPADGKCRPLDYDEYSDAKRMVLLAGKGPRISKKVLDLPESAQASLHSLKDYRQTQLNEHLETVAEKYRKQRSRNQNIKKKLVPECEQLSLSVGRQVSFEETVTAEALNRGGDLIQNLSGEASFQIIDMSPEARNLIDLIGVDVGTGQDHSVIQEVNAPNNRHDDIVDTGRDVIPGTIRGLVSQFMRARHAG